MTLPAAADFTGSSITEGQFKTAITALRTYLATLLGTDEADKVAALTALGAILCDSLDKTGAYTVVAADKGKVIRCDGTFTLSITAAATLGDGFVFAVLNIGSGAITIDPSGSELIDGATTKMVAAGKMMIVYCDGTRHTTVASVSADDAVLSLNGQTGSLTTTSLYAIGSFVIGRPDNLSNYPVNSILNGSSLYATSSYNARGVSGFPAAAGATLIGIGSWRCVSPAYGDGATISVPGLWVRYA